MRNFCGDCETILFEEVEFRFGYCSECLSVRMEKLDRLLSDYWYDDGGPVFNKDI